MYKLYFLLMRVQKKRREQGKRPNAFAQKVIDRIEWFYNVVLFRWMQKHPSQRSGINAKERKETVTVSLTSYPKRIGTIWFTIESLLRQSVKPDRIILWLANSQFASMEELPESLLKLQSRGLTIRFCDDLRSHKKYFYVMQEYPEDIIILADDDLIYPRDTVKKLLAMHRRNPGTICTMTAQKIEPALEAMPSLWRNPLLSERFENSNQIQIFTGSGSLYPPHSIDQAAFDPKLIKDLCPYADDLWLTYMAQRNHTNITAYHPWRAFPLAIYGTAEGSLWYVNAQDGQNDVQWKAILDYFECDK